MLRTTVHVCLALIICSLVSVSRAAEAKSDGQSKPLHVLLITGGCCHNYAYQSDRLVKGTQARANVKWTVMQDPRKGTQAQIDLYNDPDWAKPYDVVVHNECFANTKDSEYIRKITTAHKAGVPAVVIHCAMHTYRAAKIDDWREFLGVNSFRHEHQSEYTVVPVLKEHPIMKGFPETWKTPKDELYVIEKMWPNTKALANSKSERTGKEHAVFWVNQYGKARVFGTTFGHGNATFDDDVFIDTVTRGLLWACDKLGDDGKPVKGYEPQATGPANDSP